MSDPLAVRADLAIEGPSGQPDLQQRVHPIAGARLDFSAGLSLPAVEARVQRFGLDATVAVHLNRVQAGDGTLPLLGGFVAVHVTPHAPEIISLRLDGPLPGGGFLERAGDVYRGALGVDLGVVVVSGFASLQTSDPISLVALLAAEFRPPIQLSFGFTLVGVGGMVGVHRRVDQDQLAQALQSGDLTAMLFPRDPVGEASRILPALDRSFPPARGRFFAGPMLKLGWGTPTIVSATLAVIVGSDGVLLLGRFAISLPNEDVPFAVISATIVGSFDSQGVWIAGSLVNSHIGPITIDGDAAFKLTHGDNGTMALSAGGFHPAYTPPPGMEGMRRLSAELSPLAFASLRYEGYVAITSDSVQFGGGVRMRADLSVAAVRGDASFDALITFSPFHFVTDLRASLELEVLGTDVAGIGLRAHFSGPGHWELSGGVTIEFFWFDADVPIELEWGDEPAEPLSPVSAADVLRPEIGRRENWSVEGDDPLTRWVTLAPAAANDVGANVLSPLAPLAFVQQAVPLDVPVTRIGGRRLGGEQTVSVRVNGTPPNRDRRFPAGLFFDRPPDQLLTGNGLQACHAGVTVDAMARDWAKDAAVTKDLDYEDTILSAEGRPSPFAFTGILQEELFVVGHAGSPGRRFDAIENALRPAVFAVPAAGGR